MNLNSRFTFTFLPSLLTNLSTMTCFVKEMQFSSLFGKHEISPSLVPSFNKQMTIVTRQIVKYNWEKRWNLVFQVADFMSRTLKLTRQMTMIAHSIFTEFFVTDVTISGIIINQFIMPDHYHSFWEFKRFINVFDILCNCSIKMCATSSSLNSFTKVTGC